MEGERGLAGLTQDASFHFKKEEKSLKILTRETTWVVYILMKCGCCIANRLMKVISRR